MKQQNSLIESFHEMWDAFPGMARLINSKHEILASNQNAQDKGYIPVRFAHPFLRPMGIGDVCWQKHFKPEKGNLIDPTSI